MAATLVERDALPGLQSGDERALERVFRDTYPALTIEATTQLADAGPAASVVERAFLKAWAERARFGTAEELDAFLYAAVHDGALRERYRRARLHHIEGHVGAHTAAHAAAHAAPNGTHAPPGAPATTDEAWAHIQEALHAPARPANAQRRAELSRHEAAEHVAATLARRRVPWGTIGIAVVVGAAVTGGLWKLNQRGAEAAVDKALAAADVRVLSARPGQRALVTLLDGSQVTIGPDSKVTVPTRFGDKLRVVKLEGTAAFAAAPTKEDAPPLEVRAGGASVVATGTQFEIAGYPGDSVVIVRVREGQVQVKAGTESRTLVAWRALAVAPGGAMREPSQRELDESLAWTDGAFVVDGRPLREVLPLLQRWYALKLQVKDSALLARPVTMSAPLGVPHDAIAALEKAAGAKLVWEKETMFLRDASKAVPKKGKKRAR